MLPMEEGERALRIARCKDVFSDSAGLLSRLSGLGCLRVRNKCTLGPVQANPEVGDIQMYK